MTDTMRNMTFSEEEDSRAMAIWRRYAIAYTNYLNNNPERG